MKILDCTLRDGGYYTNWSFDDNFVKELYDNNSFQLLYIKYFKGSGLSEFTKLSDLGSLPVLSKRVWKYNSTLGYIYLFITVFNRFGLYVVSFYDDSLIQYYYYFHLGIRSRLWGRRGRAIGCGRRNFVPDRSDTTLIDRSRIPKTILL